MSLELPQPRPLSPHSLAFEDSGHPLHSPFNHSMIFDPPPPSRTHMAGLVALIIFKSIPATNSQWRLLALTYGLFLVYKNEKE